MSLSVYNFLDNGLLCFPYISSKSTLAAYYFTRDNGQLSLLIYFYFYSNTSLLLLYIIRMNERRPAYFHLNRDAMRRHAV